MSFINRLKSKIINAKQIAAEASVRITLLDEQRDSRLETCRACENFISLSSQCKLCGCFMKAKTWLPEAKCPIDKW